MTLTAPCRLLDWDSSHFGFRIACVDGHSLSDARATAIDQWCAEHQIACLYFLARSDSAITTQLAEANGFSLVDIRLTLESQCDPASGDEEEPVLGITVRQAEPGDAEALDQTARGLHRYTRFYVDNRFPIQKADGMYAIWAVQSLAAPDGQVFVAEIAGRLAGYAACRRSPEREAGSIDLLGVRAEAQRQGVGTALMRRAMAWFAAERASVVTVVTQGRNVPAQRLYQTFGFRTLSVDLWYHKWYTTPAG